MSVRPILAAALLACSSVVAAEDGFAAVRPEFFVSSDADDAHVSKVSLGWDWWRSDREHWRGVKVENARFSGPGWAHSEQRVYFQAAGILAEPAAAAAGDGHWRWRLSAGTNGDDLIGSAAIHTEGPERREFFIERELVETRDGTADGQVYTFVGAAFDHQFAARTSGNLLFGLQDFGDGNLRTHLRGNLVQAIAPEAGLSLQLRTRAYHNSRPGIGDYYSPEWQGEVILGLGLRRFIGGHRISVLAGYGGQRAEIDDGWRRARVLRLGYESPRRHDSFVRIEAGWSDAPVTTSAVDGDYSYRFVMLEGVVTF